MLRTQRFIVSFCFLVVIGLGSGIAVSADPVTITLHNPNGFLQALPGATIVLTGTLTNTTSSTLFVNSSGGVLNNNQPPNSNIVLNATFFIRPDATTFVLQPGQSTDIIELVRLFINPAAPNPSVTSGTIEICGGAGPLACDQLGVVPFSVIVSTTPITPAPTPEPATMLLLGTGLAAIATGARRRCKLKRAMR